jgi:DNA-binding LytR/AlgR family response regulator
MRVLIVDDEAIALDRLENALACMPQTALAGRAMNGREALAQARQARPDLVLLDIDMPGLDGLSVMRGLAELERPPEVVFVTALDQHAVTAFELHAADYLLKPVAFERLREAVRRAEARLAARTAERRFAELDGVIGALRAARPAAYDQEIWVRTRAGVDRLPLSEVALIRAEGDYVSVRAGERTHLVKDTLSALEARLDPACFLRVHRGAIVNLARVKGLRRRRPRGLSLLIEGGETVEVGPSYAEAALAALNADRWR